MDAEGVVNQRTLFVPYTAGMHPPPHYYNLFAPFGSGLVASLDEVSSRERIGKRCFDSLQVCSLVGMHHRAHHVKNNTDLGWWSIHYKGACRYILGYYKQRNMAMFKAAERQHDEFSIVIITRKGLRRMTNEEEVLSKCKKWRPPINSNYARTKCVAIDSSPDTFVSDLAHVDAAHAVVALHGAGANLAFFLPPGGALIEILGWDFCGQWPDQYFKDPMEMDRTVPTAYFRLVAGPELLTPGKFEKAGLGQSKSIKEMNNLLEFCRILLKINTQCLNA